MRIETLAEDVEVFVGKEYASNATLFHGPQGTLVIDALGSVADARELAAYAGDVRLIVLTHGFSDHLAGLQVFDKVPVLAHRALARTFAREEYRSAEEARFFRDPSILVESPLSLQWGKHALSIVPLPGHTESDLVLDAPSIDTVFCGDIAVGNIAYLNYSDIAAHRAALAWCVALGRGRVVQGHGGSQPSSVLQNALDYLDGWLRGAPPEPSIEYERRYHLRNLGRARD